MQDLFGKVDNLECFTHPKFNESFKFMDEVKSVNLAKKVLNEFLKSGYKNIVIIESGTSPLIEIIKNFKESRSLNLLQIKIPRDLNFNLYKWFETYLSEYELNSYIEINNQRFLRKELLKTKCENFNLEQFIGTEQFTIYDSVQDTHCYSNAVNEFYEILKGTRLYEIFSNPFLLFDEYINAGTIIRNFNGMVRLFTNNPKFKLSAYCMFLDNPEKYKKIAFTIYNNETELEAYRNGAYPFENRIDLIGYYYFISENDFEKVYLNKLHEEILSNTENNCSNECVKNNASSNKEFFDSLNKLINSNNTLEKLKGNLAEEQVKKYVTNNDIIRCLLKTLDEKIYGKNKIADFLDQVFELYAPSWSPMPVIFHLDYWNGFSKIQNEIENLSNQVLEEYKKYRLSMIKEILESLEENNKTWKETIKKCY